MGFMDIFKKKPQEEAPQTYDFGMQTNGYYNTDPYAAPQPFTVPTPTPAAPAMELKMVAPTQFSDVAAIAKDLKSSRTVVINMSQVQDPAIMQRMLDFLSGVAFCLEGQLQPIEGKTYIITPGNIDVTQAQFKAQQQAQMQQPAQPAFDPMQAQYAPQGQPNYTQIPPQYAPQGQPYGSDPNGGNQNGGFGGGFGGY